MITAALVIALAFAMALCFALRRARRDFRAAESALLVQLDAAQTKRDEHWFSLLDAQAREQSARRQCDHLRCRVVALEMAALRSLREATQARRLDMTGGPTR